MRTLSVKEVAGVLGLTKRAVMYRLENGKLKGTRVTNPHGQEEWRVYPNKEIMQAVDTKKGEAPIEGALNFEPEDVEPVEAESVTSDATEAADQPTSWRTVELERLEVIAEKLVKPLTEKLEAQAMALKERDLIIEDQGRQLRLLPDLERRAREAEQDKEAAQIRAMETEALRTQIAAMQEQIDQTADPAVEKELHYEKEVKESELQELRLELEQERTAKEQEIKALEEKLASVEEYKKLAEEAQRKLDELNRVVEDRNREQESEKAATSEEIKRLQEEKDSQATAIREELAALSQKFDKSQKPWWKKFLGVE